MRRRYMLYFAAVIAIIVTTAAFAVFASGGADTVNTKFLKGYGWETNEKAVETVPVMIPEPFDSVYEGYNEIQLRSGLDLRPYKGMKGIRYTYIVENYPKEVNEEVRANVICIDGEPVAGDIMTVNINGFMHSLRFSEAFE